MNLSLPVDLKSFVDRQAKSGGFGTASEYVRDLLRQARRKQAQREFEEKLLEGINSEMVDLDDAEFSRIRQAARAAAREDRKRSKRAKS